MLSEGLMIKAKETKGLFLLRSDIDWQKTKCWRKNLKKLKKYKTKKGLRF